jgi:poly(A)-specific ribonuclease
MSAKDSTNAVATSPSNTLVQRLGSLEVQQSKTKKKKQKQKQKLSRFACTNAFEALETQNTEPTEPASDSSNPDPQPQETTWESATVGYDGSKEEFPIDAIQWQPLEILPAFNSNFWDKYGNRLRVFGTEESVLEIASWEEFPSAYR